MTDVPDDTPVTNPEVPTVAIEELPLDQLPPAVVFVKVVLPETHIDKVPVIAGTEEVAVTTRSSTEIFGRLPVEPPEPL